MKTIRKKFYDTIKPLWDFRMALVCAICLGIGFFVDEHATQGVLLFCLFVPPIWVVSLTISKILWPGLRASSLVTKACETPMGAAVVYAANRMVLIAIGLSFILWWVRP